MLVRRVYFIHFTGQTQENSKVNHLIAEYKEKYFAFELIPESAYTRFLEMSKMNCGTSRYGFI